MPAPDRDSAEREVADAPLVHELIHRATDVAQAAHAEAKAIRELFTMHVEHCRDDQAARREEARTAAEGRRGLHAKIEQVQTAVLAAVTGVRAEMQTELAELRRGLAAPGRRMLTCAGALIMVLLTVAGWLAVELWRRGPVGPL